MKFGKAIPYVLAAVYANFLFWGVCSILFGFPDPAQSQWGTPVVLLLASGVIVMARSRRSAAVLITIGTIGYVAEVIGVQTGWLFGSYVYTDALGPKLWGAPPVMAAAWVIVPAFAYRCVRRAGFTGVQAVGLMALLITTVDLLIEPVAVNVLGLWAWAKSGWYYGVPATNFLGWIVVSIVVSAIAQFFLTEDALPLSAWVERTMLAFFVLISLVHLQVLAVVIGVVVLGLDWVISLHANRPSSLSSPPDTHSISRG